MKEFQKASLPVQEDFRETGAELVESQPGDPACQVRDSFIWETAR